MKITAEKKGKPLIFPCLMESIPFGGLCIITRRNGEGLVGTCIHTGDLGAKCGEYSDNWDASRLIPITSPITITIEP
jgi:hypothetical protein